VISFLPSQSAEILLFNGIIGSGDPLHPLIAGAQAIAIAKGHILAVGSNDDIFNLSGPSTTKIDLRGRLVVPGFTDSHIHFYEWSLKLQDLQFDKVSSLKELIEKVRQKTSQLPLGQWIMGQGWNETDWDVAEMPTRSILDKAAPHHPVLLWRCDLHLAVANSRALELAGIDSSTDDPQQGRIERDSCGEPTGVLLELAINLVRQAVAPPDSPQIDKAFTDGIRELHRFGITGIHDIRLMHDKDGARALQSFQQMELENSLDLRCWVTLPGHQLDEIIGLGLRSGFGNEKLRLGHVKYFSDGGMGARTAWMIEPYLDAEYGMPLMDMKELAEDIDRADRNGLAVMVHGVGDRANHELVDIFTALQKRRTKERVPAPAYPHRIEHMQMIRPEDALKLTNLQLALCVTPSNMILDINLIDRALGERGKWTYAFRQLFDTGAQVMFSSDCPVCSPDPLPAIHAAVTRQRMDGTPSGGWYPEARVTAAEALAAFTSIPAAVHQAHDLGTIAQGKKADLAVLSNNILSDEPEQGLETNVDMTLFDGRIVHQLF
jgi:predicted amidohydrolase YtcJ